MNTWSRPSGPDKQKAQESTMFARNLLKVAAVCGLAASLIACASDPRATTIGVAMPHGERATIVAHNQDVPDWMIGTDSLRLNFVVKGDVSDDQLRAVAAVEGSCRIYTKTVRPNELVAVAINGILYGATGFLGTGGGAALAFKGASFMDYGKYGGTSSFGGGVANGLIQGGGKTYTFEDCGREIFSIFPQYEVHILQKSPY